MQLLSFDFCYFQLRKKKA